MNSEIILVVKISADESYYVPSSTITLIRSVADGSELFLSSGTNNPKILYVQERIDYILDGIEAAKNLKSENDQYKFKRVELNARKTESHGGIGYNKGNL